MFFLLALTPRVSFTHRKNVPPAAELFSSSGIKILRLSNAHGFFIISSRLLISFSFRQSVYKCRLRLSLRRLYTDYVLLRAVCANYSLLPFLRFHREVASFFPVPYSAFYSADFSRRIDARRDSRRIGCEMIVIKDCARSCATTRSSMEDLCRKSKR